MGLVACICLARTLMNTCMWINQVSQGKLDHQFNFCFCLDSSHFHHLLQFNDLQECYLQKRRQSVNQSYNPQERDKNQIDREGYSAGLANFQSVLSTFTRYRYDADMWQRFHFKVDFWMSITIVSSSLYSVVDVHILMLLLNSRLRVIAELRHGDLFHSANIVSRWIIFCLSLFIFQFNISYSQIWTLVLIKFGYDNHCRTFK